MACRNRHVGVITAAQIRKLELDVVVTSGQGGHATVVVPRTWTHDEAERLAMLFEDVINPARRT